MATRAQKSRLEQALNKKIAQSVLGYLGRFILEAPVIEDIDGFFHRLTRLKI